MRELTDATLRALGAGTATAHIASESRVSKAVRPVERNILLVGMVPLPPIFVFIRLTGAT